MQRLILKIQHTRTYNIFIPVESFNFSSDFLITCDSVTLSIGQSQLPSQLSELFVSGGLIGKTFYIYLSHTVNNIDEMLVSSVLPPRKIFVGIIDKIVINESRSGLHYQLGGRNVLGPLCDTQIDPKNPDYQFNEGQTLSDVLTKIFNEFNIDNISTSDQVNRKILNGDDDSNLTTTQVKQTSQTGATGLGTNDFQEGSTTTTTTTISSDKTNTFRLDKIAIKKIQPEHNETYMTFIQRNLKRFGLNCWGSLDDHVGNKFTVIVGKPDYSTDAIVLPPYISKVLTFDLTSQPQLIVAQSHQGGGKTPKIINTVTHINEFIGYDQDGNVKPQIQTILDRYKQAKPSKFDKRLFPYQKFFQSDTNFPRVIYLQDQNSRGIDQLQRFASRKMSEYQSKAIQIRVTIPGFTYKDNNGKNKIFKINTMVNFQNNNSESDSNNIFNNVAFWIQSCNFKQDRSGSTTELTLIPAYTLKFDPADID